jgi:hypothetical protein
MQRGDALLFQPVVDRVDTAGQMSAKTVASTF